MRIEQIEETLANKGFKKEKQDSGYEYSKRIDHIKLICFIEPNISISFISIYTWDDNDIKGVYTLTMKEFGMRKIESIRLPFVSSLDGMPEFVGERNVHAEIEKTITDIFD